jgi:hypothetical protein
LPISIRRLKQKFAAAYAPWEPIRVVLEGEPDEMSREEILSKMGGWIRLIRAAEPKADPARPANSPKDRTDGRQT